MADARRQSRPSRWLFLAVLAVVALVMYVITFFAFGGNG